MGYCYSLTITITIPVLARLATVHSNISLTLPALPQSDFIRRLSDLDTDRKKEWQMSSSTGGALHVHSPLTVLSVITSLTLLFANVIILLSHTRNGCSQGSNGYKQELASVFGQSFWGEPNGRSSFVLHVSIAMKNTHKTSYVSWVACEVCSKSFGVILKFIWSSTQYYTEHWSPEWQKL